MSTKTKSCAPRCMAGVFATAATASFAQTTTGAPMTHADKKAAKKQAEADKDAAVAQAKRRQEEDGGAVGSERSRRRRESEEREEGAVDCLREARLLLFTRARSVEDRAFSLA